MPEPLVEAHALSRTYGRGQSRVQAVREATCTILPGDCIALVGPSGSGKSTLLHLLGGLDSPDSGEISWPGIGASYELRPGRVIDIFQGPSLLAPLTLLDNICLPMLLAGIDVDEADRRATLEMELLGIADLAAKLPEEVSGGQAQRAAVARAIAVRPRLILADEPTGQLDSRTAASLLDHLIASVRDLDAALVISTHDPRVAERMPVRWSMRDGQLSATERLATR